MKTNISDEEVVSIRKMWHCLNTFEKRDLATKYGLSMSAITNIAHGYRRDVILDFRSFDDDAFNRAPVDMELFKRGSFHCLTKDVADKLFLILEEYIKQTRRWDGAIGHRRYRLFCGSGGHVEQQTSRYITTYWSIGFAPFNDDENTEQNHMTFINISSKVDPKNGKDGIELKVYSCDSSQSMRIDIDDWRLVKNDLDNHRPLSNKSKNVVLDICNHTSMTSSQVEKLLRGWAANHIANQPCNVDEQYKLYKLLDPECDESDVRDYLQKEEDRKTAVRNFPL